MGKVKSALERAMERVAAVEGLSEAEKEDLKGREQLRALLAAFYKGEVTRDGLWEQVRGIKPSLLRGAQQSMADSIRLGSIPEEFRQRKDGILALETLKELQNTSVIEGLLRSVETVQKEYREKTDGAVGEMREAIEKNPQMRLVPVKTPDGKTVLRASLSVDEAVQARVADLLADLEKSYEEVFGGLIEKLKSELK